MIIRLFKIIQVKLIKEIPIHRWNIQKLVSERERVEPFILTRSPAPRKSTEAMRRTTHLLVQYGRRRLRPGSVGNPYTR
jgi:hypothetical protein